MKRGHSNTPPSDVTPLTKQRPTMADVHAADKAMEEQYKKILLDTNKAYSLDLAQLNTTYSPFLRLPAELRNKVYSYIFTKRTYHLTISADNKAKLSQKNTTSLPAPLTICRQIYDKAEKLRCAQTTFSFETRAFMAMGQSSNVAINWDPNPFLDFLMSIPVSNVKRFEVWGSEDWGRLQRGFDGYVEGAEEEVDCKEVMRGLIALVCPKTEVVFRDLDLADAE